MTTDLRIPASAPEAHNMWPSTCSFHFRFIAAEISFLPNKANLPCCQPDFPQRPILAAICDRHTPQVSGRLRPWR